MNILLNFSYFRHVISAKVFEVYSFEFCLCSCFKTSFLYIYVIKGRSFSLLSCRSQKSHSTYTRHVCLAAGAWIIAVISAACLTAHTHCLRGWPVLNIICWTCSALAKQRSLASSCPSVEGAPFYGSFLGIVRNPLH